MLELLDSPKLISRKIWVIEKSWNFHTVSPHHSNAVNFLFHWTSKASFPLFLFLVKLKLEFATSEFFSRLNQNPSWINRLWQSAPLTLENFLNLLDALRIAIFQPPSVFCDNNSFKKRMIPLHPMKIVLPAALVPQDFALAFFLSILPRTVTFLK